jgi:hypothetical protein
LALREDLGVFAAVVFAVQYACAARASQAAHQILALLFWQHGRCPFDCGCWDRRVSLLMLAAISFALLASTSVRARRLAATGAEWRHRCF